MKSWNGRGDAGRSWGEAQKRVTMETRGTDIYRSERARGADKRPKNGHKEDKQRCWTDTEERTSSRGQGPLRTRCCSGSCGLKGGSKPYRTKFKRLATKTAGFLLFLLICKLPISIRLALRSVLLNVQHQHPEPEAIRAVCGVAVIHPALRRPTSS